MLQALHNSDAELRREREQNASRYKLTGDINDLEVTRRRIDELTCENRLLTKSIEEGDKRAASLQASLSATEESLRRLVEAVKTGKQQQQQQSGQQQQQLGGGTKADQTQGGSCGVESGFSNIRIDRLESDRSEIDRLREQLNEAFHRGSEAEKSLIECEMTRTQLKDVRGFDYVTHLRADIHSLEQPSFFLMYICEELTISYAFRRFLAWILF